MPPGPVALLGCPGHENVGDQAIWLGQREAIWSLGRRRPVYTCSIRSYDHKELRRRLRRGTILLTGGGNLGDLYPAEQRFRERVLRDFPDRRVVVLPQSVRFRDPEALDRAGRAFEAHPDLTLTVRTRRSLEIVTRHFAVPVYLLPDMATALGPLPRTEAELGTDLLYLLRSDAEADRPTARPRPPTDGVLADWGRGRGERDSWRSALHWLRWRLSKRAGPHAKAAVDYLTAFWTRRAWHRVSRGVSLLSGARTVITDRLHGHILATQLGTPHVTLDNSYGKVHSYVRTWNANSPLVRTATDIEDARRKAGEIRDTGADEGLAGSRRGSAGAAATGIRASVPPRGRPPGG